MHRGNRTPSIVAAPRPSPRGGSQIGLSAEALCALRYCGHPAGLEAAHIQWHHVGGPDIEANGLPLCTLHHKLLDPGAFTVEPTEHRVIFSQHAMAGDRDQHGELRHHGQRLMAPQAIELRTAPAYLTWNQKNVFKAPARKVADAGGHSHSTRSKFKR